jgi:transposase-like protein
MVSIGIDEITEEGKPEPMAEDLRMALQELMELEAAQNLGAEKYERVADRSGERNGYRERSRRTSEA